MQCAVCLLVCVFSVVSSANILAVFPTICKSHYIIFDSLIKGLAQRGHNITVITAFPQEGPVENVHEISVKSLRTEKLNSLAFKSLAKIPEDIFSNIPSIVKHIESSKHILNATKFVQLLSSDTNFDLIICELFLDDVFLAVAHRFPVPVIGISSALIHPWTADWFGIPANPSYVPILSSGYAWNMDFYQRAQNTFIDVALRLLYWAYLEPKMTEVVRDSFGSDVPPVSQMVKNISLCFTNTHFSLFGAQPYPPQVVDVSGLHLKPAKPLPQVLSSLYFTNTHFSLFGAQPYPPQVVNVSGLHLKPAKPIPQVLLNKIAKE